MPTSQLSQLSQIIELIALSDPKSILDVGVGFGKYGFLAREYLELWDGRERYNDWTRRIDGIEAHAEYITPMHRFIYDDVMIGDALKILPTLKSGYDLVLLIDVLEHFEFEAGRDVLRDCMRCARNVLVSVPRDIGVMESSFDNPHQTHRFQWEKHHFRSLADRFFIHNHQSLICYVGPDARTIRRKRLNRKARDLTIDLLTTLHLKKPIKRLLRSRHAIIGQTKRRSTGAREQGTRHQGEVIEGEARTLNKEGR